MVTRLPSQYPTLSLSRLVCMQAGVGDHVVVLVRGYMHRTERENRGAWVHAVRAGGFLGDIYELEWDASSPKSFLRNVMAFRDWKQLKRRARRLGQKRLPRLLGHLEPSKVSLVGVSAGARVIYHALTSNLLGQDVVHDVVLLGGAIRRRGASKDWEAAASRVSGRLVNVYSKRDAVLATFYRATNLGKSPCGLGPIDTAVPHIENIDATPIVRGGFLHMRAHSRWRLALEGEVGKLLWQPTSSGGQGENLDAG